jgi:phenylalanyl-tRNA synthetase beta chain
MLSLSHTHPLSFFTSPKQNVAYPDVTPRTLDVDTAYINGLIGTALPADEVASLLARMGLAATPKAGGNTTSNNNNVTLTVSVPPTRSDVLHACDVAEDVAIAHGYNNIKTTFPPVVGRGGREAPLAELCEALRVEMAGAGFTEVLTWALCPAADCGPRLRRPAPAAARITGAATAEFEIVRTALLPGALRTLASARDAPLPVRLFEVGDVVLLDRAVGDGLAGGRWGDAAEPSAKADGEAGTAAAAAPAPPTTSSHPPPPLPPLNGTGATNARRLVALVAAQAGVFQSVHGLLNRVMQVAAVPLPPDLAGDLGPGAAEAAASQAARLGGARYGWTPSADPAFLPGRQAAVTLDGHGRIGVFGIVHPDVVAAFGVVSPMAVGALELDLEPLCFDQAGRRLRTHLDMGQPV